MLALKINKKKNWERCWFISFSNKIKLMNLVVSASNLEDEICY